MRRLLVVCLVALFGLPLLAAAPLPSFFTKPNVIVYPFTTNGSTLDREASSRLATIIATQMAATGKIAVIAPPPGTDRKDYLTVARAHNAEYYITGYISPLGDGASMVAQVVSTTSGIVVYSTTTQLTTYADAASQGDGLAGFISQHANRGLAAIGTPPAAPPTPQPQASQEAQANLTKIFGRKKKPAAKPSATPTPAGATRVTTATTAAPVPTVTAPAAVLRNVTPPATTRPLPAAAATSAPAAVAAAAGSTTTAAEHYAVVPVDGSADAAVREVATARLLERTHGERVTNGAAACAAHNVRAVLNGTLTVRPDTAFGGHSATFDLHVSDCAGHAVFHHSYSNDAGGPSSAQLATERVVEAAVGAFLNPPKRR